MRLRNIPGSRDAIEASKYVVQNGTELKGRWSDAFGNANPIQIEIGMGKGAFIMEMARRNPSINFVGIEKYSSVLLRAIQKQEEEDLPNLLFIRMEAEYITDVFAPNEVQRIYLNFSDPWPKERHAKRRLTSCAFLKRYEKILVPEGEIHFKTDNTALFDFSLEAAKEAGWSVKDITRDLHQSAMNEENIMTEYEERFSFEGKPINKLIIKCPDSLI